MSYGTYKQSIVGFAWPGDVVKHVGLRLAKNVLVTGAVLLQA